MSQINHQPDPATKQVRIMVQGRRAYVPTHAIEYLKSDSNYCNLHFTDKNSHLVAYPMGSMLSKVGEGFIRLHSRYLCNSAHLKRVDLRGLKVTMQSGGRATHRHYSRIRSGTGPAALGNGASHKRVTRSYS